MPVTDYGDEQQNVEEVSNEVQSNGASTFDPSIVDLLRRDVDELAAIEDVLIPVEGFSYSNVSVKYRLPEQGGKELDAIAKKVMRETKDTYDRNVRIAMDTMIALCEGLYVQPEDTPEPVPFDPDGAGMAIRFDHRLAEIFELPEDSNSRTVLRKLFGNNDASIVLHAEKLSRWIMNRKADLEVEVWQTGEAI